MLTLYDTTLRDGAQGLGVNFSLHDKLKITKALDQLGVHYIEGGFPGSNPSDEEYFHAVKKVSLKKSVIVAFGSTARPWIAVGADLTLARLLAAETSHVTIFGKSSAVQVRDVLKTTLSENLKVIHESVRFLTKRKRTVFYDAEHFFDGFLHNSSYALQTIHAAKDAGAAIIILCDTNGGMCPWQIEDIVERVKSEVSIPLGIHSHNDSGVAVANSLYAIRAGCSQVHGTVNGFGERTGNADLLTIIANIYLKMGIKVVSPSQLRQLTHVSRLICDVLNLPPMSEKPYVGEVAFAHKGGMHIDGVVKTGGYGFEHIDPALFGN